MDDTIQSVSDNVNAHCIRQFDTNRVMATDPSKLNTAADRLKWIREYRQWLSAAEASRRFNWKESTYRAHENGGRNFDAEDAADYARHYGCNVVWLMFGGNYATPFAKGVDGMEYDPFADIAWSRIPLLNAEMSLKNTDVKLVISQATEFIAVPGEQCAGPLTFAQRVIDDSMVNPERKVDEFKPGEIVIFDCATKPSPGDYVLADLPANRGRVFRQFRLGSMDADGHQHILLMPNNPNYPMEEITPEKDGQGAIIGRLRYHHKRY